jgi:8-amino-7-oxononanoate synthase
MRLFDKFSKARNMEDLLNRLPMNPTKITVEKVISATEAVIKGQVTIMAGTNNYLGVTFEEECIRSGQSALAESGTGTTGSRMANGTYQEHLDLERELADFYQLPFAMVFSTGYGANLGCLSALLGPDDAVLLDAEAHASLFDGCRMSGADIYRFKHSDPESLLRRMKRLGEKAANALIVVEGLYSIRGDCAPLREIVDVKREVGGYLYVDEAHSFGLYGERGAGLAEECEVLQETDFIVGTFSKSLGSIGGFCVSPHEELNLFRYCSRPYIFTASPSPATVATTRAALAFIRHNPRQKKRVWENARALYEGLGKLGLQLGPEVSPVIGVSYGSKEEAFNSWQTLLDRGVYTNLILPPAAPDGGALIRCSITAAHTAIQIKTILESFAATLE